MKKLAFLEYAFIFDPDTAWGNIYDFENVLGKFFKYLGYEANVIDAVRGHVGRRVIFITKITDLLDKPGKPFQKQKDFAKAKKVNI